VTNLGGVAMSTARLALRSPSVPDHPPTGWPGTLSCMRVLPAGRQDQRHCCRGHREQGDQAGGRCPTGSGRPPDLIDQPPEGVFPLAHCYLLNQQRDDALPSAAYKPCGRSERLGRAADLVNAEARDTMHWRGVFWADPHERPLVFSRHGA
jgi:hypothetical protein